MTVENTDGETLGRVKDFVVDISAGKIPYAIVSSGGMLGISSRLKIAPVAAISLGTAKKGVVSLPVEASKWAKAPAYNKRQMATRISPERIHEITDFYGVTLQAGPSVSATGRGTDRPAAPYVRLASDLIGMKITDENGKPIGAVSDFAIDFYHDKPPFVILRSKGVFRRHSYAVPLSYLSVTATKKLVVHLGSDGLALE